MKKRLEYFSMLTALLIFFMNGFLNAQIRSVTVWQNGRGSYNNYRIPSLLVTSSGTLLAFSEGREGGDAGDIDLLVKRSADNGQAWSEEQVVWDDNSNTCGNPTPVEDVTTGRIWLFMTWNLGSDYEKLIITKRSQDTRRPYLSYSDDDGRTWSKPVDMTESLKMPSWGWYATGPGIGIQLTSQKFLGRLVVPANHSYDDPAGTLQGGPFGYGAHVLISDDHGKSWRKSQPIRPGCNESQVVELSDGRLLMNMRSYNNQYSRAIATSDDGGETWSEITHDRQLVESRTQASIFRFGSYKGQNMILFSNPAVPKGRTHMTVKVSFDDCQTWSNAKLIHAGPSAYSSLARLQNGFVGLLFEYGRGGRYDTIRFVSFPPEELFAPGKLLSD